MYMSHTHTSMSNKATHCALNVVIAFLAFATTQADGQDKGKLALRVRDTTTGIEQKVIVATAEAKLCAKAGDISGASIKLKPFEILFQLQSDAADKAGLPQEIDGKKWIHVEKPDNVNPYYGWMLLEDGELWKTRSLLLPRKPDGNTAFRVFGDESLSKKLADATAGSSDYQTTAIVLAPAKDERDPVYSVVIKSISEQLQQSGTASEVQQNDFQFEIVYVIDTTASMTPLIEGVKEIASQIAQKVAGDGESKRSFRFGLVEYQDATPGLTPARIAIPLTDFQQFANKIRGVAAARIGSQEWQEDVVAGLLAAVDGVDKSGTKLGWTENSFKLILLIGDADALLPGQKFLEGRTSEDKGITGLTIDGLLGRAASPNGAITGDLGGLLRDFHFGAIHAIHSKGEAAGASSQFSDAIHEQFEKVAKFNSTRGDHIFRTVDAQTQADITKISQELSEILLSGYEATRKIRTNTPITSGQMATNPVQAQMWEINEQFKAKGQTPVTLKGWATPVDSKGRIVGEEAWFLFRDEFERAVQTIEFLEKRFVALNNPTKRANAEKLLNDIQIVLAETVLGQDVSVLKAKSFKELLGSVPLRCEMLDLTPDVLGSYSDAEYKRRVLDPLRESIERGTELLNGRWEPLDPNEKDSPKHQMVKLESLP